MLLPDHVSSGQNAHLAARARRPITRSPSAEQVPRSSEPRPGRRGSLAASVAAMRNRSMAAGKLLQRIIFDQRWWSGLLLTGGSVAGSGFGSGFTSGFGSGFSAGFWGSVSSEPRGFFAGSSVSSAGVGLRGWRSRAPPPLPAKSFRPLRRSICGGSQPGIAPRRSRLLFAGDVRSAAAVGSRIAGPDRYMHHGQQQTAQGGSRNTLI